MGMKNRKRKLILLIVLMMVACAGLMAWLAQEESVRREAREAELARRIAARVSVSFVDYTYGSAKTVGAAAIDHISASHVISHRGKEGPDEHSFDAYDAAIAAGSEYIEQDLVQSSDGTLYVSHDKTAYAMTGDSRSYSSMSDAEIDSLRTHAGRNILKLSDVFDRYGDSVTYVIELKTADAATVDAFCRIVREYGLEDCVIAQCFFASALEAIESRMPDMPKMLVCMYKSSFDIGLGLPYIDMICANVDFMDRGNCDAAHEAGKKFGAWTLNYEQQIRDAIDIGADFYFTNDTPLALSLEKSVRCSDLQERLDEYLGRMAALRDEVREELRLILENSPQNGSKNSDGGNQGGGQPDANADGTGSAGSSASDAADSNAKPVQTLFFASDYQAEPEWDEPREILSDILDAALDDGKTPDKFIYCGDYTNDSKLHDYQLSPDDNIEEIRKTIRSEVAGHAAGNDDSGKSTGNNDAGKGNDGNDSSGKAKVTAKVTDEDFLFVQGNHDALTDRISETGLYDLGGCLVYVLNTQHDFPWKQGKTKGARAAVQAASGKLEEALDGLIKNGETRPVFIAGHVPLHYTARTSSLHTTGDNLYSGIIFDVVNEAAGSLDIVYLFGHNHSKGWDCCMGGACVYKGVDETLLIPVDTGGITSDRFTEKKLRFTYLNAGYTGYYMNCSLDELLSGTSDRYHAADETLTGTICEIYKNRIVLTRYARDGIHRLGADGEANPYCPDGGLIDPSYYSRSTESPQTVALETAGRE